MIPFEDFRKDVLKAVLNRPKWSRKGQACFNYIEEKYGNIARYVQFIDRIDCFYDDTAIDPFISACYNAYCSTQT